MVSLFSFIYANPILWAIFPFIILTISYYIVSLLVTINTKSFDFDLHNKIVASWRPKQFPSVDIFLPTCGEDIEVLKNTWDGVALLVGHYRGAVTAYVLDDSNREIVANLALQYKFQYKVRPNPGEYKKAGNLRYGFSISKNDFIIIFDADFRPRIDFINELLPYMHQKGERIGIVQSPQYFDVNLHQNWLERGAGATQELFYRFTQVSRNDHKSAICVGSNAIYRRSALNSIGGTALVEHSEDVHTGINLRMKGWDLVYIPVILAKGLCPESMTAFFNQQYRWCMGSMSLMISTKFWELKIPWRSKLSYISGFLYYIHTAISSIVLPIIPLFILIVVPESIDFKHSLLIIPSFIFSFIIYPLWHKNIYGIEVRSVQNIYGWAHLIAIFNIFTNNTMSWNPTGSKSKSNIRYYIFRISQIIFNFIPALLWLIIAGYYIVIRSKIEFIFIFIGGLIYFAIVSKPTFYRKP